MLYSFFLSILQIYFTSLTPFLLFLLRNKTYLTPVLNSLLSLKRFCLYYLFLVLIILLLLLLYHFLLRKFLLRYPNFVFPDQKPYQQQPNNRKRDYKLKPKSFMFMSFELCRRFRLELRFLIFLRSLFKSVDILFRRFVFMNLL